NQAFEYNGRVIGLQFHLESSSDSIKALVENCGDELVEGKYIQNKEQILSKKEYLEKIQKNMENILDQLGLKTCS
ncbi:MAG: amidotransferase, partial [Candidatus Omnitrophota bacterium]|nr:amidotransferase [Candidatus Omnitrophota bacterium]